MAVIPAFQRKGIGSQLVIKDLQSAKNYSCNSVIVVGHPGYYPRFGFKPASLWNIKTPFQVPDEAFLALELAPNALAEKSGTVEYPEEFHDI